MANQMDLWRGLMTNPFREMSRMQNAIDRLIEDLPETGTRTLREKGFNFAPSCDASEDNNQYLFKFDIPGVSKEDIKIELVGNRLSVSAERKEEKATGTKTDYICEIDYGSYSRSFTLPEAVDEKRVDAKYNNGVLSVTVPKIEAAKAKQIAIH